MPSVYFHVGWDLDDEAFLTGIEKQTPGCSGVWGSVEGVTDPADADYYAAMNWPGDAVSGHRTLLFAKEPPCLLPARAWDGFDVRAKYPLTRHHKPQTWWVDRTYDELCALEPMEKPRDLSWITTDKGRDLDRPRAAVRRLLGRDDFAYASFPLTAAAVARNAPGARLLHGANNALLNNPTRGHRLRMAFLDRLVEREPGLVDLYGRGEFACPEYRGTLEDKWAGLAPYRYSLAVENYSGPNYFSEKVVDPLLAWCMPIYWGCTNLGEYLPEDSFVELDVADTDAPARVREIVESDRRERRLDAIAEARRRILDRYQVWPTVEDAISGLDA